MYNSHDKQQIAHIPTNSVVPVMIDAFKIVPVTGGRADSPSLLAGTSVCVAWSLAIASYISLALSPNKRLVAGSFTLSDHLHCLPIFESIR
jgi:hypothetical protein